MIDSRYNFLMAVKNELRNRIVRPEPKTPLERSFWDFSDWFEAKLYQYLPHRVAYFLSMDWREPVPSNTSLKEQAIAYIIIIAAVAYLVLSVFSV